MQDMRLKSRVLGNGLIDDPMSSQKYFNSINDIKIVILEGGITLVPPHIEIHIYHASSSIPIHSFTRHAIQKMNKFTPQPINPQKFCFRVEKSHPINI